MAFTRSGVRSPLSPPVNWRESQASRPYPPRFWPRLTTKIGAGTEHLEDPAIPDPPFRGSPRSRPAGSRADGARPRGRRGPRSPRARPRAAEARAPACRSSGSCVPSASSSARSRSSCRTSPVHVRGEISPRSLILRCSARSWHSPRELMRRNRFDRVAKDVGKEALRASGTTLVNEEINSATQYADLSHAPDPARKAERDRLGLLGRLAADPCLIEVYSEAPSPEDFRACLLCRVRHNVWRSILPPGRSARVITRSGPSRSSRQRNSSTPSSGSSRPALRRPS
jgi:hypothetical protein